MGDDKLMRLYKLCLTLCVCSLFFNCTSVDGINDRLDKLEMRVDNLESAISALQQAYEEGKIITDVSKLEEGNGGWSITFSDYSNILLYNGAKGDQGDKGDSFFSSVDIQDGFVTFELLDGTTFTFKMVSNIVVPKLVSIEFRASANPTVLIEDVQCIINENGVVDCWIRHTVDSKQLIPHFTFEGDCVVDVEGNEIVSDETTLDFKSPQTITVKSGSFTKDYTIYVHSFTGLPVLWIDTENQQDITSKETYIAAHLKLIEDIVEVSSNNIVELEGKIKGRGNSTWGAPKKPYRLKFDSKVSLLGEPKDKSWVLLANYYDKTAIRNEVAFYMGSMSNIAYTPRFHYVDVMLNGKYNGTYQLGDHLKISKDRVNVGDDGFLVEIDWRCLSEDDARYFYVPNIGCPINVKDPDVEYDDANFTYVKDYLTMIDGVLFSDNFKDPDNGWRKYMDMDSFVDWFLINELAKNADAQFGTSCYMNLKRDGKLCMGPLWDFDLGFGNYGSMPYDNPEGFYIRWVPWYNRMFQDPVFVNRVKERFNYFYNNRDRIMNNINVNAKYLKESIIKNDGKWGLLKTGNSINYDVWENYMNEVQKLKSWMTTRFEWLKVQFDAM